ncbi:hypothetical protein Tco_1215938 [Tanacetum coccineum]
MENQGSDEEPSNVGSPGVIIYGYDGLPMHLVAPPSLNYVPGPKHPPSPDYMPGPEHPPLPVYVPEPEYLEYLVPSDVNAPMEEQPLLNDVSPIALSSGYVANFDPEEDPKEDPKEDHTDYPTDGGDGDDESSDDEDEDDDPDDEDEEASEEEEHLALVDSSAVPVVEPVPSGGDTEAFETNEFAPTPPSPRSPQIVVPFSQTRLRRAPKMVRPQTPIPFPSEVEVARLLALPTPQPSPLTPLSSLLPQIPSLPLPISSLPLPLPSPPTTSPTYVEAPLGYRAVGIRMRAASPPLLLLSTSHRTDIPEAKMPPRKRACFTTPASGFEVGESSAAAAARQPGPTLEADLRSAAIEAHVKTLEAHVATLLGHIQTLEARDLEPQDEPAEAGSSC